MVQAHGCICTADWNPVCGDNILTYSNTCMASCEGVTVLSAGECNFASLNEKSDEVSGGLALVSGGDVTNESAGISYVWSRCFLYVSISLLL